MIGGNSFNNQPYQNKPIKLEYQSNIMNENKINNDYINNTNNLQKNHLDSKSRIEELAKIKNLHAWQVKNKELGPYVYSMVIITIACLFIPLGDSWQALLVRIFEIIVTVLLIIYWIISKLKSTTKIDPFFNEKQLRLLGLDNINLGLIGLDNKNKINMVEKDNNNNANQPIKNNYPDIPRHNIINKTRITSPSGKVKYDWKEFDRERINENSNESTNYIYDNQNQNKYKQQNNYAFANKNITSPGNNSNQIKYRIDKYCKSSINVSPNGTTFADVVGDERNNKIHVIFIQDKEFKKYTYYSDWRSNLRKQSLLYLDKYYEKFYAAVTKLVQTLYMYHYPDIQSLEDQKRFTSHLLFENFSSERLITEDINKFKNFNSNSNLQNAINVYMSLLSIYSMSVSSTDNNIPIDYDKVKRMSELRNNTSGFGRNVIDDDLVISLFIMECGNPSNFLVGDLNEIKFDDSRQLLIGLVKDKSSSNKVKSSYNVSKYKTIIIIIFILYVIFF
jgi:hypothetical protein